MDDYDSDEERKHKKKKRPPPKVRNNSGNSTSSLITRSTRGSDNDKPFLCSCKAYWQQSYSFKMSYNLQCATDAIKQLHLLKLIARSTMVVSHIRLPLHTLALILPHPLQYHLESLQTSGFLWCCLRLPTWMVKRMLSRVPTVTSAWEIAHVTGRVQSLKKWCLVQTVADQVCLYNIKWGAGPLSSESDGNCVAMSHTSPQGSAPHNDHICHDN